MTGSDPPDNNTNVRSKKPPTGKANPYLKKPPSQRSLQTPGSGASARSRVTSSRRPSESGGTTKAPSTRRPSTSRQRAEGEPGSESAALQMDLDSLFDSDGSFRFQDVPKDVMGELINHLMDKMHEKEQNLSMSEQVSMTLVAEVDQKNARIRELESQLGVQAERLPVESEGVEPEETVTDSTGRLSTITTAGTTKRRSFSMSEATESTVSPIKKSNPERRASETITAVLTGATISSDDTQAAPAADEQAQCVVQRATKRFTELKQEFQSMAPYLRSFAAPGRRGVSDGLNVSHAKATAFRKDGITEMLDTLNNQAKDPQQEITLCDNLTAPQHPSASLLAWSKELNLATDLGNLLLLQVRHLQGKLSELEVESFTQGERNDEMEKKVELQAKQIARLSEEYEAAKVRAWDMELVEQNLRDELKEITKHTNRLQKENESLQKAFNNANDTVEQLRCSEEKLTKTVRNNRSRHEQDMNQARRNLISLQRDKKDLQKKVNELKADLSGRIQRSGGRLDGAGGSPSASTSPSGAAAEPAEGPVDLGMHDGEDSDGFAYPRTPAQRRGLGNGSGWPPGSVPSTGPHAMHVQTLTGSLAHAHRTMDKLRASLRRHKQENLELKLMLSEHQETIESLQRELTLADPGQTHPVPQESEAATTSHEVVDPVPGVDGVRRADQDWLDVDDDENVLSPRRTSFPIRPQTAGKRRRNPRASLRHSHSHSTLSDQGQCSGAEAGPGSMNPTMQSTGYLLHKHPSQSSLGTPAAHDDVFGPSQGTSGRLSVSSHRYNRFARRTNASNRASLSAGPKSVGTTAVDAELSVLDGQSPAGQSNILPSGSPTDSALAVPGVALVGSACENSDVSDSELLGTDSDPQVSSANRSTERRRRVTKKRSFTRSRATRSGRQRRQSTHRRKLSPGEGAPQVAQSLSDILNTAAPPPSHLPLASPAGRTVENDDDDDLTGSPLAHLPPPAVHRFDPTAALESPLATRTIKGKVPQCPHCHGELGTTTVDSLLKTSSSDSSLVTVATQTEAIAMEHKTVQVVLAKPLTKDSGCQRVVDTQDANWGTPKETPLVTADAQTATVAPTLVDTATPAPLPSPLVDACQQTASIHRTFGVQANLTVARTDQSVQTDSPPTDDMDSPVSRDTLDKLSPVLAADARATSSSLNHAECQTDPLPLPPTTQDKVTTTYETPLAACFWAQDASTHAAVTTVDAGVGTVSPTVCTTGSQTITVPQMSVSTETPTVECVDAEVDAVPLPFSIENSAQSETPSEDTDLEVTSKIPSPAKGRRMSLADSTALDMPFSGRQFQGQRLHPTLVELDERSGELQPTRNTASSARLSAIDGVADVAASSLHSSHDDFATPDDYSSRPPSQILSRTDSIRSASPSTRPMMCARCRSTALVPVMASPGDSAVHISEGSGRKRDSLPPLHDQAYLDVLASAKTSRTPQVGERRHSEGFLFTLSRRSTGRLLSPRSDASEAAPQRDAKLEQTLHTLEGRKSSQDVLPSDHLVTGLNSAQLKPQASFSSSIATTATSGGGVSVGYPAPGPVPQSQRSYGTIDNLETSVYSSTSPPLSVASLPDSTSLRSPVHRPASTLTPGRVSCATQTEDVVVLPKCQGSGSPVVPTRSSPLRPTTSAPRALLTKVLTLAPPVGSAIPPSTNPHMTPSSSQPMVPHRTMGDKPPLPPTAVRSLRTYGSLNNISQLTSFGTDTNRGQQTTLEMDSAPPLSLDQMITSNVGASPGPETPHVAPSSGRLPSQHPANTSIFNRFGKRTPKPASTPVNHRSAYAPEDRSESASTPASSMVTGLAPSTVPSPHVLQVPTRVMSAQPSRGTMAPSGHVIFEEGYSHAHPSATAGLLGPVGHRGSHMMLTADPLIIHAITQTMVGEFMWKSTRHKAGGVMRERRHLRFFWIHPYTKTIHWSSKAPGSEGGFLYSRNMAKSKSAYLKSVRVISDYQCTNENDLSPYSFIVQTSERELKFKAISRVRHDIWYQALSYLQTRPVISANTLVKNSVVLPQHRDKSHIVTHPNANSTSISVAMPPSHMPYSGPPVAYENTAVSGRLSSGSRRSPMLQSTGGNQGEFTAQAMGSVPDPESSGSSSTRGRATPSIFKKSSYSYLLQKLSPYHMSPASAAPSSKRGDSKPTGSDRSRGPSPMDSPPWTRQAPEMGHAKTKRSFLSPPTMASLVPRRHSSNALGKLAQPQTQGRNNGATPWEEEMAIPSGTNARGAEADEGELTDQSTAPSGGIMQEEGGRTPSKRKLMTSLFSHNQPAVPPVPCLNTTAESSRIDKSSRAPSVSSLGLYAQQSSSDKGKQPTGV